MKRFRFTLRDLLWLVLVVGLALGWGTYAWRSEKLARAREDKWIKMYEDLMNQRLEALVAISNSGLKIVDHGVPSLAPKNSSDYPKPTDPYELLKDAKKSLTSPIP